jgi:large subunit ribosomal protein L29
MMKIAELKTKKVDELNNLLANGKKELFNLRFQKVNGTLTNTARVSIVKKTIARINTLLRNISISKESK